MRKELLKLFSKYETELQLTMPELHEELSSLLEQKQEVNSPEAVKKNRNPHYTCDFVEPISRHIAIQEKPKATDTCQVCFEKHPTHMRECDTCGERHDGCCEITV